MKKLLLSLVVASCATSAFAQKDLTGSVLLYGTGGYASTHGEDRTSNSGIGVTTDRPRTRDFIVAPGIGFSVNKHLTVGVNFAYVGSKVNYDRNPNNPGDIGQIEESKVREIGVGPFVRYTQMLGEHFFVFGQVNVNYLNGRSENDLYRVSGPTGSSEDRYDGVNASYFPAVGVMFGMNTALSFSIGGIGYEYRKYDYDNNGIPGLESTSKQHEFALSIGQQFNLGIQKYFGCGRSHKMKGRHEMMDDTRMMDTRDDEEESDMPKRKTRKSSDDE